MIARIIIGILFICAAGFAAFAALKALLRQDKEREDKWTDYEHRK